MSFLSHKQWAAAALVVATIIAPRLTVTAGEAAGVTRISDRTSNGAVTQVNHNAVVWQGTWSNCDTCVHGSGMLWPDAGWNRPMPTALRRAPVVFSRRWPQSWHGQAGAARAAAPPTVYQPTDTTQLGFIYHRVPQWQPNPKMLPPAPWPATWHSRRCPGNGCVSVPIYTTPVSPQMAPQPVPPQPAPAKAEPQKTAANGI